MLDLIPKLSIIILARTSKDTTSIDPTMMYLVLSLMGVFVFFLILIFLRKTLIPLFNLWYIVLVYGKFSFEFLEFFKANNLRNPHNSCIRDEITMHFLVFFKHIKSAVFYSTKNFLEYGETPFLISYKLLVKKMGNPECINITRFSESKVRVVGYNEIFNGINMKSLYYFIDEKFVMGEYLFSDVHRADPDNIISMLSAKYLDKKEIISDCFYIIDPSGNKLNYENNGFSVNIRYLFLGDERINGILESIFLDGNTSGLGFRKAMKHEELLNRF